MNHYYDRNYLQGYITEKEFNAVVLICSKIAARAYSNKQTNDRQKTSSTIILCFAISSFIALVGVVLLVFSAVQNN